MKRKLFIFILFFFVGLLCFSQVRIKMEEEGGVYTTPCKVNGLNLRFIFDTGASYVSISLSEALFMLKNGYLSEEDLRGSSYSQLANGEVVDNTSVILHTFEIGGITLNNVEAIIIHELSAPLLLGQSAIKGLGSIQIDGNELILMDYSTPSSANSCLKAALIIEDARNHYYDCLYSLSVEKYQKVYDLCPNIMNCFDIHALGRSYYEIDQFHSAIEYFEKVPKCSSDSGILYWNYLFAGESYKEIKEFNKAQLNAELSLCYSYDNNRKSDSYSILSEIFMEKSDLIQSIDALSLSIKYCLLNISSTEGDVMKGKVNSPLLGEKYYNLSFLYFTLNDNKNSDRYMIKSALSGYTPAIEYCKESSLRYDLFIE